MSAVAFLVSNRYQMHHYHPIAAELSDVTFIIDRRPVDLGVDADYVRSFVPGAAVEELRHDRLRLLDGVHHVIVSHTPVLPQRLFNESLLVCQQYSLAKLDYQLGAWRALADLNLLYGASSLEQVSGWARASVGGNPSLDEMFSQASPNVCDSQATVGLYVPTYGDPASVGRTLARLGEADGRYLVKPHQFETRPVVDLPANCELLDPSVSPAAALDRCSFVISDVSGAAFDGLYAGRPLVRVGRSGGLESDMLLADLSTRWHHGEPINDAIERARAQLSAERHASFVESHFANHGVAGRACAEHIRDLVASGPQAHVSADRVAARQRELLAEARELGAELRSLDRVVRRDGPRFSGRASEFVSAKIRDATDRAPALQGRLVDVRHRLRGTGRSAELRRAVAAAKTSSDRKRPRELRVDIARSVMAAALRSGVALRFRADAGRLEGGVERHEVGSLLEALSGSAVPVLELAPVSHVTSSYLFRPISEVADLDAPGFLLRTADSDADGALLIVVLVPETRTGSLHADGRIAAMIDWSRVPLASQSGVPADVVDARYDFGPIDAVYTWVDGSDEEWRGRRARARRGSTIVVDGVDNEERFVTRDELRYSLRSLADSAPWIRTVHLVTEGHVPAWLDTDQPGIEVVTHAAIFPDAADLPTFNSHAIEACLHRIPGLAEHFIYFNDDVFLGREVGIGDFFTPGGLPTVRFSHNQIAGVPADDPAAIPTDWAAANANAILRQRGHEPFERKLQHAPHAQRRSVLMALEADMPHAFASTRSAPFRSATDISVPSMLAGYVGVREGLAVPTDSSPSTYVDVGREDAPSRLAELLRERPTIFCLNATSHRDIDPQDQGSNLVETLDQMFPLPSPFEFGP